MAREYPPVPQQVDLPQLEHDVLDFWRTHDTFEASLDQRVGAPRWTFYEGPPTANGTPGTHHIEARVFKDVFPRFKTMQGFLVDRKAGWDCQGLPVEVAVEKELGLSGKQQIEAYGIADFNERCRASVMRHVDAFREMTERMGYWVDLSQAYWTMNPSYIESVWWSLKQIFEKGLLFEAQRVSPYCPRCETALSDHELGQGYETVADPSVYVRLPLTSGPLAGRASLLVWTTTPWTLVSNTSVAAHPEVEYVVATDGNETLIVARPLFEAVLGEGWTVTETLDGRAMERWAYTRPLDLVAFPEGPAHFVTLADYVTTDNGTGLVHQSPAYGGEDLDTAHEYDLPVVSPVRPDGHFADDVPLVGGEFFKHADEELIAELERRGVLFRHVSYEHSYPHCWRCHTPLMYYALPAWYIRTTAVKDALLRENEKTNWVPETIKHGRYGDWLNNNVDWALSRTRYWGTPLPLWRNEVDPTRIIAVGSLAELSELAGRDLSALDPHRPFVDDVTFTVDGEPGVYRRVPEVIDAWYDSGAMPFAQWGYPHLPGSAEAFTEQYPAQFICEALDQTRGWFYSLMAVGTLLFDQSSYENVVCLGLLLAEDGRKMSKHLGNILEPIPLMDQHGADALRWFMAASGSPWSARRVGHASIQETVRKVLLTYWNTVAFHVLYARTNGWTPHADDATPVSQRPVLDRWLVSRRNRLVGDITSALEQFDTQRTGQLLSEFVDELSNWYVRRSRRRFWDGDDAALTTLHETLDVLTRLMAPMTPFITERVWQDLVTSVDDAAPDSVHLAGWPEVDEALVDADLDTAMALTQRLVELGRSARSKEKIKTRQPLAKARISTESFEFLERSGLLDELAAEVNVNALEPFQSEGQLVDYEVKPNFRELGRRFGPETPTVAAAIRAASGQLELAGRLLGSGEAAVDVNGESVVIARGEVVIAERPLDGWSVVNEHGETIALDVALTPELVRAGLARDAVRLVQEARKSAGLDVSDRITLTWSAEGEVAAALREHSDLLGRETLAVDVVEVDELAQAVVSDDSLGLTFSLQKLAGDASDA